MNHLRCPDAESRRHAAELIGRDMHWDLPGRNNEAVRMRGYPDNAPWPPDHPLARRPDPRLGPTAGQLYGKSATPSGQPMVSVRPPDIAVTQPVNWTTGSETSTQPSSTAQQSTLTPGLLCVAVYTVFQKKRKPPIFWQ